ncbi:hypothetical protein GN956_G21889 [Arapaima gigas]
MLSSIPEHATDMSQPQGVLVFAVSFLLLPLVLLACACCRCRKSRPSAADNNQVLQTKQVSQLMDSEAQELGKDEGVVETETLWQQRDPQGAQQGEEPQRSTALATRRLPSLPRHSVSSDMYDVVVDIRDDWPPTDPGDAFRKSSSCGSVYMELQGGDTGREGTGATGDLRPATPATDMQSSAGAQDFPVYAKVKKGGARAVKSELILYPVNVAEGTSSGEGPKPPSSSPLSVEIVHQTSP